MPVHDPDPGPAELGVRLHARCEVRELLPRSRVRRGLHQPRLVREPDEHLLLRELEHLGDRRPDQGQDAGPGARPVQSPGHHQWDQPPAELGAEPLAAGAGLARSRRILTTTVRRRLRIGRGAFVAPPLGIVLLLLLGPIVLLTLYSVNLRTNIPFAPTVFSSSNWKDFLTSHTNPFRDRFFYSMKITLLVSLATVIAAYPLAYFLAFVAGRFRYTLLLLLIAPFFTSYLLRIVAWSDMILNNNGIVNQALWAVHLRPSGSGVGWLLYSNFSIFLVLFYAWIPFVSLP